MFCPASSLMDVPGFVKPDKLMNAPFPPERLKCCREREEEEEEIFYMFRPDNTSDHMQQGLMTLHQIISLQQ